MKKITLTEALSKLKLINKKIEQKIVKLSSVPFIDYRIGKSSKGQMTGLTEEEIKKDGESTLDSLNQLTKNRDILKAKIAQANAKTEVDFGGNKYTIVEIVELKKMLPQKKVILSKLQGIYSRTQREYSAALEESRNEVQEMLSKRLGSDAKNQNAEEIKKLSESLSELNKVVLMNPLKLEEIIEEMEQEIDFIENELDVKLSIVNAQTFIEIPDEI